MWSGVALSSFNWRAIGGYQSSVISADGIRASQDPVSSSVILALFFFKRRAEGQFAAAKPLLLPHRRFIHTTMNHLRQVRRTVRESVTH